MGPIKPPTSFDTQSIIGQTPSPKPPMTPTDQKAKRASETLHQEPPIASRSLIGRIITVLTGIRDWIANKINSIFQVIFGKKAEAKTKEPEVKTFDHLGLDAYKGDSISNMKLDSQIDFGPDFKLPINLDAQKSIRYIFKKMTNKGEENKKATVEVVDVNNKDQKIQVPSQLEVDFHRLGKLTINDQTLYESKKGLSQVDQKRVANETFSSLNQQLGSIAFFNLGSLLVQTVLGDATQYLTEKFNHLARQNGRDEMLSISQITGEGIGFDVKEEEQNIVIVARQPMQIMSQSKGQDKEGNEITIIDTVGYVTIERQIVLSKEDLNKDWTKEQNLNEVAPSLNIKETISRYEISPEAATAHLESLKKLEKDLELL